MIEIQFKEVKRGLDKIDTKIMTNIEYAILVVLHKLKKNTDDKDPKTPHKTGDLKGSAQYNVKKKVGVLRYTEPYALYQHEGMRKDGTHVIKNYTGGGDRRKFLEKEVIRNYNNYIEGFGKIIKTLIK